MIDNPFGPPFVNALLTYLQQRKGVERRSRQSIVVPNGDGHKYVVSHSRRGATTPQWVASPGNNTSFNSTASVDPVGVKNLTGIVQLMSNSEKESKVVAYLTAGTYNNSQVLEATGNKSEASTMSLSGASPNPSCSQSLAENDLLVSVCEQGLCATYDPWNLYDQAIELQPLFTDPSKSNKSQSFTYSQSTKKLTPVSCMGGDSPSQKANSVPSSMDSSSNSTSTSSMPQASRSSERRRDSSSSSSAPVQAQNVTLIFVPDGVKNNAIDIKADSSTSTVTHTVTSTIYSSAYPTPSGANVAAVSVSSAASSSSVMASSTPSGRASGMNVELVGNGASSSNVPSSSASNASSSGFANAAAASSAPAISSSVSGAFGAASVTASPSPSASVNAAAIAASLASSYRTAARYSASSVASPSGSGSAFGVASASASAMSSAQPAGQSVLVAAAWRREAAPAMATVNTDPYTWKFSRE